MKFKLATDKILITGIVLLLLSIAVIMAISISESKQVNATAKLVSQSQEALFRSEKMVTLITEIETRSRGYLLTGQTTFLEVYEKSKKDFPSAIQLLRELIADNPQQKAHIDTLNIFVNERIKFADSLINIEKKISEAALQQLVIIGNSSIFLNKINAIIEEIQAEEKKTLGIREKTNRNAEVVQYYVFLSVIFLVLVLLTVFFLRVKHIAADDERKRSEAMFRGLLESAPDAMVIVNEKGSIVLINKQTEKLFGYNKDELIRKPVELLMPENFTSTFIFKKNLINKQATNITEQELAGIKKSGERFPVAVSSSPFQTENGLLVSAAIRDITERKKTQEQLEFLSLQINKSNDAIYTVDANAKIKSWSRGAEHVYGFTAAEAMGRDSNDILKTVISNEEKSNALEEMAQKDYWTGELKRKTKTGKDIFVSSSSTTIRDNNGVITGYVAVGYDITEQKKLREQVNHLANIVEQSSEAIISIGLDQRIISWNKGAEKLFGYTSSEALGKTSQEIGLSNIDEHEANDVFQVLMDKGFFQTEMDFYNKDGTAFFATVIANLVRNEQGEKSSIVFTVKDISLRKRLEETLKRNNEDLEQRVKERTAEIYKHENRFRALIENNNDIITLLDSSYNFFYRSPSALRVTGWTNEEMEKLNGMANIHPDDIEKTKEIFRKILYNPGEPIDTLWRSIHKDGHYMWLEGVGINLLHDENVKGIVYNFRDVTERIVAQERLKASEEQFRHSLDSMLEGVQIINFDWEYIYVNDSFTKHAKYSREELIGHTVMEKFPGIEQAKVYESYLLCFNERLAIHIENEFLFPDNTMGWFELSFQPVPEGIFILSIDITERKKAQLEIEKLNEELEQKIVDRTEQLIAANNDLEAFSYSVSHDLRSPLRGIHGFASILDEDYGNKLDDEAKRIIGVIKSNTSKMGHLIDDLLAFLRMGRHEIIKSDIDSNEMVNEIIKDMELAKANNKIEVIIHPLPFIKADINTMRQVWINFISNAVKYSRNAIAPRIEIGADVMEGQTVFYIKDNGVGFDSQYKNKLFKVFQRLHSVHDFEGTGVGLAIVEKIISKHNGKVWVDAAPDKGACFYFSLPNDK